MRSPKILLKIKKIYFWKNKIKKINKLSKIYRKKLIEKLKQKQI